MVMSEMRVVAIGVDPRAGSPVLLLREAAARQRVLPVWVGPAEANAIELERRHIPTPRPLAHQLICQVIGSCGRRLERMCVTSLHEGTFHAELVISPDVRVSARVSDAVAIDARVSRCWPSCPAGCGPGAELDPGLVCQRTGGGPPGAPPLPTVASTLGHGRG
jgi:bifunctional DNase/RNase